MAAPWSSTGLLTGNKAEEFGKGSTYALRGKMTSSSPTETATTYTIPSVKLSTVLSKTSSESFTLTAQSISSVYVGVSIGGTTKLEYSGTSITGTKSGSIAIAKTHQSQSVTLSLRFDFVGSIVASYSGGSGWSDFYSNTGLPVYGSHTFTVPAKTHYTVSFNANSGSGAPSAQTKWHGETLTLSSTKPTRMGYTFLGWSTSSTATSATYASGGSYTANAAAVLYAVWRINTWTVAYNANGGTGAPASQTKTYNQTLTLSSTRPARSGYTFLGWAIKSDGTGAAYAPGGSYTDNAAATLYAVWVAVQVTSLSAYRSTSAGTRSDSGTYGHLSAGWKALGTIAGTVAVTATANDADVTSSLSNRSGSKTATADLSNTSVGTFGGSYVQDAAVRVSVTATLTVSYGGSSRSVSATRVATIPKVFRLLDALHGGTGLAIGAIATLANTFEVALTTIFNNVSVNIKSSNIDRDGGTPTESQWSKALSLTDVDGNAIGAMDSYRLTSGESGIRLIGYAGPNGASVYNTFRVGKLADGTNVYYITDPPAFREAANAVGAANQASQNAMLASLGGATQLWALRTNVINSNNTTYHGHNTGLGMTNTNAFLYDFTAQKSIWTAYTTQNPQPPEKWDVYKSTTVSQVITAASGITVSSVTYAEWGKVAMLSVTCTGFSASTGTQTVGTVVSGKRPVYNVYATDVNSSYAVYAQLTTAGALTVYWGTAPSTTGSYTVRFIYLLA